MLTEEVTLPLNSNSLLVLQPIKTF